MHARIHRFSFGTTIAIAIAVLLLPARAALGLALTVNSTVDEPAADPTISTCISTPSGAGARCAPQSWSVVNAKQLADSESGRSQELP